MYKVESAVLTELQVPCVCFTATDVSRQLLLPGVHTRNCKNRLVYGDRLTTEFRLVGFFYIQKFSDLRKSSVSEICQNPKFK